jgi:hypothetical protein
MVVVLSKVWPRRRCAWGELKRSRMLSRRSDEGWSWHRPPGLFVSRENGGAALQKYFSYRQSCYSCNVPSGLRANRDAILSDTLGLSIMAVVSSFSPMRNNALHFFRTDKLRGKIHNEMHRLSISVWRASVPTRKSSGRCQGKRCYGAAARILHSSALI